MKREKIIYWITTALISSSMLLSAISYFVTEEAKAAFYNLGYPDYFRIELGIAKFFGAIILLLPMLPTQLKIFTYSGFTIVFVSAIISHLSSSDPISIVFKAALLLALLIVSYIYFGKLQAHKQNQVKQ